MIDVLEQLVADGKYREAIKLAEQILRDGVETPAQLVAVQSAMVAAQCGLQDCDSAIATGEAVLNLAREIGDWDAFGKMAIFQSVTYSRLGQFDAAIAVTYDYIANIGKYRQAISYEYMAWLNLGRYFLQLGRPADAVDAYTRGLAVVERTGDHRNAHGARHALIDAALKAGDYSQIPRLLARSVAYLRRHPEGHMMHDSWAYHMRLRAEYALATGRPRRAMAVAVRGLVQTDGVPHHACRFHMLLAKIAEYRLSPFEAVGHAMAAQSYARGSGRPDVEAEAADTMYQVCTAFPNALGGVEQYYLKV